MRTIAILFALVLPIVGGFVYVLKHRPNDYVAIPVLVLLTIIATIVIYKQPADKRRKKRR
jgi:L-lactate permease